MSRGWRHGGGDGRWRRSPKAQSPGWLGPGGGTPSGPRDPGSPPHPLTPSSPPPFRQGPEGKPAAETGRGCRGGEGGGSGGGEAPRLTRRASCSWTNHIIDCNDHQSVQVSTRGRGGRGGRGLTKPTQINIAHVDENGVYTGQYSTVALAGKVRSAGDSDSAIDLLWQKKKADIGQ